jgi:metallo-beta-lactamase class B
LLTTQAHYDHVAGMAEIKKLIGAKMMVHEADAQVLADGGESDYAFGGRGKTFAPVMADRILHDGDAIQLGGMQLTALHHPGHTKGSTSFLLEVRDEERPWTVLIVNMPSILSETRISGMPSYPKVREDYYYTLQTLKKIKFDLWVASHASQFGLHDKRKPGDPYHPEVFVDRAGFEASVNGLQHEYDRRLKSEKK